MVPKWGKAGQRLTEAEARRRRAHRARNRAEAEAARNNACEQWAAGKLVPAKITNALDWCGLYGPEVDEAVHAREPDVDNWEAGLLYPRWDQVEALSALTGFPVSFFVKPVRLSWMQTSMIYHLKPGQQAQKNPVLSFNQYAIDARMRGEPSPVVPQFHGQLDLFDDT